MPKQWEQMNVDLEAFLFHRTETKSNKWLMHHAHRGIELLYIHEGEGWVTLEHKVYPLRPGTLFCFQPYQFHRVEVPPKADSAYLRTNITFDPGIAERYTAPFPKLQAFLRRLARGALTQQVFTLDEDRRIEDILDSFQEAREQAKEEVQDEERGLFLLALLRHLQLYVFPADMPRLPGEANSSGHVERMLDWLELHYRQPFQLKAMAREMHLSPHHISHLFKQRTGFTLSDYIAVRRLREACMLLANTDKPVGDIGKYVGGFSAPYFCQLFKKHIGATPQSYRAAIRQFHQDF